MKKKNLSKKRRNEIAYILYARQTANNGMHFTPIEKGEKSIMRKLGVSKSELVAFAGNMATDLAEESFKKKWRKSK